MGAPSSKVALEEVGRFNEFNSNCDVGPPHNSARSHRPFAEPHKKFPWNRRRVTDSNAGATFRDVEQLAFHRRANASRHKHCMRNRTPLIPPFFGFIHLRSRHGPVRQMVIPLIGVQAAEPRFSVARICPSSLRVFGRFASRQPRYFRHKAIIHPKVQTRITSNYARSDRRATPPSQLDACRTSQKRTTRPAIS